MLRDADIQSPSAPRKKLPHVPDAYIRHRWLDNLTVEFSGYDANDNEVGAVQATLSTTQTTVINLRSLGTVYQVYISTNSTGSTPGTAPSCISNNSQIAISSFTFQGVNPKAKNPPRMYIKGTGGDAKDVANGAV